MINGGEMEKKIKMLAQEEQRQKVLKQKIKNFNKNIKDLLKTNAQAKIPNFNAALSAINIDHIGRTIYSLQSKNQYLIDQEESLKEENERIRRHKLNIFEDKEKYEHGIKGLGETIKKIQKAIDDSVEEEVQKRKKIQDDLDKSIAEIKQKIKTFEEETVNFDKENEELRVKKEELLKRIDGMESEFKKKAEEKDEAVKEDKEKLLGDLKEVEEQVNEATQMSKRFSELERENFDNRMAIYMRVKKFPQFSNSFENSAKTIDECKQQLFKGVARLQKAIDTIEQCDKKSKQISVVFLQRLKVQTERQQKIDALLKEKQDIKMRIQTLQQKKREKLNAQA